MPAPLPGLALKEVNLYLINERLLIDAGQYSIQTLHVILKTLRESSIDLKSIEAIIITHFHADHLSLAPVLKEIIREATIYIGYRDWELVKKNAENFVKDILDLFIRNGVPETEIRSIIEQHPVMRLAEVYKRDIADLDMKPLREGDRVFAGETELRVIECPGHTPGSICLYNDLERIIFVGDVVLQDITPSVIYHNLSQDPLNEHINSLKKIIDLRPREAYPGHRELIRDPANRASEIIDFHMKRLEEIISYLKEKDHSTYELAKRIKWRVKYSEWDMFPPVERFFALGETLAHLMYLYRRRRVDLYEKDNKIIWYLINN
ncbi:MAG: MBL fold metallo-hydrolase [Sulfolobales archaeon]